jgi:protein TonB
MEDIKMFDKLIVSEPEGADFKNRRKYFVVSSLVVGIMFSAAVVFSIFASDYSLGTGSFELTELIAPPQMMAVEPEPLRPQAPQTQTRSTDPVPTRQLNMSRVDEPTIVPTTTSTVANNNLARPNVPFNPGKLDTDPNITVGPGREPAGTGTGPSTLSTTPKAEETDPLPVPPPPARVVRPAAPQSLGVINGIATNLPKPAYPATAIAINLQGKVDVQVLIDESGRVISAKAISGNALFRQAAEQAARNARFSPTFLSKVPVKVTGVIVYNFSRG